MNNKSGIMFNDCVWGDEDVVFSSLRHNAICRMNRDGGVQILDSFPGETCKRPFSGIFQLNEDEYLFSPDASKDRALVLWNRNSRVFRKISFDNCDVDRVLFSSSSIFRYGKYLYAFQVYPQIIRIEENTFDIKVIRFPNEVNNKSIIWNVERVDDSVFIPMINGRELYVFDLRTERFESVLLPEHIKGIFTIVQQGRSIFLTGDTAGIVEFNLDTRNIERNIEYIGELSLYSQFPQGKEGYYFGSSAVLGDDLYLLPGFANTILKYNIPTRKMEPIHLDSEEETRESIERPGRISTAKYTTAKKKGDEILFCSFKNESVYIYNTKSNGFTIINPVWLNKDEQRKALKVFYLVDESMAYKGLRGFIDLLI